MIELLTSVNTLTIIWIIFGLVLSIGISLTNLHIFKKMLIIALIFGSLYVSIYQTIQLFGYPVNEYPNGKFKLEHYSIETSSENIKNVVIVVKQENEFRMYRIPYTENNERKLSNAIKKSEQGISQIGEFKNNNLSLKNVTSNDYLQEKEIQ